MSTTSTKKHKNSTAATAAVAAVSSRSVVRDGGLIDTLTTLQSSVQRALQYRDELFDIDQYKNEIGSLNERLLQKEDEIKKRNEDVERVNIAKRELTSQFEESAVEWRLHKERLEKNLKTAESRKENFNAREIQTLNKEVQIAQKSEQRKDKQLREAQGELLQAQKQLKESEVELKAMRDDIGTLESEGDLYVLTRFVSTLINKSKSKGFQGVSSRVT
jgi:predicted  nucleic acid-binding Zn-ribbon protein